MPPKRDLEADFSKILEEMKQKQSQWSSTYYSSSTNPPPFSGSGGTAVGGPFVGANWPTGMTQSDPQVPALQQKVVELEEQVAQLREQLDLVLDALEYLQMMKG